MNKSFFVKIIHGLLLFFVLIFVFAPIPLVMAAETKPYVPLTPLPNADRPLTDVSGTGLSTYLGNTYKLGVGIATVLAVLMIMWGGIEYMSTDAMGGKEAGKERINNAIFGLLLALGSWIILRTINVQFINTTLNIAEVKPQTGDSSVPLESSVVDDRSALRQGGAVNSGVYGTSISDQLQQLGAFGSVTGKATNFGYRDAEDNGKGSPLVGDGRGGMVNTNNANVMGVALPRSVLESYFGISPGDTKYSSWAGVRNAGVEVTGPSGQKEIVPIVDLGPGAEPISRGVVIDETYALNQKMGSDGQRSYKIIPNYYSSGNRGNVTYVK